jgi:hypothetical protein
VARNAVGIATLLVLVLTYFANGAGWFRVTDKEQADQNNRIEELHRQLLAHVEKDDAVFMRKDVIEASLRSIQQQLGALADGIQQEKQDRERALRTRP